MTLIEHNPPKSYPNPPKDYRTDTEIMHAQIDRIIRERTRKMRVRYEGDEVRILRRWIKRLERKNAKSASMIDDIRFFCEQFPKDFEQIQKILDYVPSVDGDDGDPYLNGGYEPLDVE